MIETFGALAGVAIIVAIIALVILTILMPFYIYGTYRSCKRQEETQTLILESQLRQEQILTTSLEAQNNIIRINWDIKNKTA